MWDLRDPAITCAETGGRWAPFELDDVEGPGYTDESSPTGYCFYPNITQDQCQPAEFCGPLKSASGGLPARCLRYCYWPELTTKATCSCSGLPAGHPAAPICSLLTIDALGNCTDKALGISLYVSIAYHWFEIYFCLLILMFSLPAQACAAYGGMMWNGSLWYEDYLTDQASCESLGQCPQPLVTVAAGTVYMTQDQCNARSFCQGCSNCTSASECTASVGSCSDSLLQPAGACHYYPLPSTSGFADCTISPGGKYLTTYLEGPQGCFINPAISSSNVRYRVGVGLLSFF